MSEPTSPGSLVVVDEDSTRAPERLAVAIIVVLIGAFLGQVLRFPFIYDDHWTIVHNPVVTSLWNLPSLLGFRFAAEGVPDAGRPTMLATILLDVKLWGFVPLGFHLQNLFWHAAASVFVLFGLRHVTMSLPVALFGASLFAVHPLNVEAVTVVNYREDLLVGTFLLAALFAMGAGRRSLAAGKKRGFKTLAFILFVIAAFAKESAYVAPLLVLVLDWLPPPRLHPAIPARGLPPGRDPRERWLDATMATAAVALVFVWRALAIGRMATVSTTAEVGAAGVFLRLVEGCHAFIAGLFQVVAPRGLSPEYDPATVDGFGLFMGALAILVTAALGLVVYLLRRRASLVALGLAFALVAYLPTLGFIGITNERADRYFYVPMMGLVLVVVSGLSHATEWLNRKLRKGRPPIAILGTPVVWLIAAAAVAGSGMLARAQSTVWADEELMWARSIRVAPNSPRAWAGYASSLLEKRKNQEAEMAVSAGLQRFNEDSRLRELLALVYMNEGSFVSACSVLKETADDGAAYERAQRASNLGYCLMQIGRLEEALPHFEKSRKLAPWFDQAWTNEAEALRRLGRETEAKQLIDQLNAREHRE
ncbi:MAG: tetratricopeptide repeat protein [Deltaproteobacteria bacterium]|nr:tetratricopeptide repeat protein [Deltaproteobacteria bacterium]